MNPSGNTILAITGPAALVFVIIFLFVVLFPFVFYLMTLKSVIKEIGPENRKMPPDHVWLTLIPIFGIVWQFFIVIKMAESLKLELKKRNVYAIEEKPGYKIGIAYCILFSCSIIPGIGILMTFAGFACWIIYWIKINDYRNTLIENPLNYLEK